MTLPLGESSTSGNLELTKFAEDYPNWGDPMNANLDKIDGAVSQIQNAGIYSGTFPPPVVSVNGQIGNVFLSSTQLTDGQSYTVPFSTTPVLSSACKANVIVLTSDIISSTWPSGIDAQEIVVIIAQDSVGGHAWVWPTNVRGGGYIDTTESTLCSQTFMYIGLFSQWVSTAVMQTGL